MSNSSHFGTLADGTAVERYILENSQGMKVSIISYGGIITKIELPDAAGETVDVVLGHDNLQGYMTDSPYFGCITGRFANRIDQGRFTLDGQEYALALNNGAHHLHGGMVGFDKVVWSAQPVPTSLGQALRLHHLSPDGHESYPGNLDCTVTYTLTNAHELRIDYTARTDKPTIVNLTNHSYFNLAGYDAGTVLDHEIMIDADHYTPADETLIPTGEIAPVEGTPFDLRRPVRIGDRIDAVPGGFDHNFVLNKQPDDLTLIARVSDPKSGRTMDVFTTEPGLQFYSGNFLDGAITGKGATYPQHAGLCLEAQHYPNSPNTPAFPSVVLRPGETYRQTTVYKFGF